MNITVKVQCEHCGKTTHRPLTNPNEPPRYCDRECRQAGYEARRTPPPVRWCEVCGEDQPSVVTVHGMRLCRPMATIWWNACRAKIRYPTWEAAMAVRHEVADGRAEPSGAYGCDICGGFHATSSAASPPAAYLGDKARLAAAVKRTGTPPR